MQETNAFIDTLQVLSLHGVQRFVGPSEMFLHRGLEHRPGFLCALFLEIISLVLVDEKITDKKKELIDAIKERMELTEDFHSEAQKWVNQIIPLYKRGFELIEN